MTGVPRAPLILGLAGLIPFVWGALTTMAPDLQTWGRINIGPRFIGPYVGLAYGTVILSFMSGVLWGFAAKAPDDAASFGYGLSVLPALWAFFMVGGGPVSAGTSLVFGFLALLILDWQFWRLGLTPSWWMQLRVLLTSIVVICLLPVVFL